MAFENDTTDIGNIHAIDRERGIILRDVTPLWPDMKPRFILEWGGQEIPFGGNQETSYHEVEGGENKFNFAWHIHYITLPEGFNESEEDLFKAITEALDTYGEFFDRSRVNEVTVNFDKDVFTNTMPVHWMEEING